MFWVNGPLIQNNLNRHIIKLKNDQEEGYRKVKNGIILMVFGFKNILK